MAFPVGQRVLDRVHKEVGRIVNWGNDCEPIPHPYNVYIVSFECHKVLYGNTTVRAERDLVPIPDNISSSQLEAIKSIVS